MSALNRLQITWRAAQDIQDGQVVNLGIGLPVHCSDYLRPEFEPTIRGLFPNAEIALILRQTGFRGGQRFEDSIADKDAGLVRRSDEILRGGNRRCDQMNVCFQALTDHSDGIANAILCVDQKFMR